MSERKLPIDPAVAAALGEPTPTPDTGRKRPKYPSEERRSKATFDLGQDTIDAIKGIAADKSLQRGQSKVAQALLDWAVSSYQSGEIDLELEMRGPDDWRLRVVEK